MIEASTTLCILIHDTSEVRILDSLKLPSSGFSNKWLSEQLVERFNLRSFLLHDGGLSIGELGNPVHIEALSDIPKTLPKINHRELPSNVRPWQCVGWITTVQQWIDSKIIDKPISLDDLEIVSTYDLACVLVIGKHEPKAYFKVTETTDETKITIQLVKYHPELIPEVLAYDSERAWLLNKAEGHRLSEVKNIGIWHQAITNLANFHTTSQTEILLDLATPYFDFQTLLEQTKEFIASKDNLNYWNIPKSQQFKVQELIPQLQKAHTNILALKLGECCCHGDAQPMNALWNSSSVKWFDWSEACIAHPMTDIGWTLAWLVPKRQNLALNVEQKIMLNLWETYLETTGIRQAHHLMLDTMIVALMHRVLAYHQKYYQWQGTVVKWKPQYVNYYLRLLCKVCELQND